MQRSVLPCSRLLSPLPHACIHHLKPTDSHTPICVAASAHTQPCCPPLFVQPPARSLAYPLPRLLATLLHSLATYSFPLLAPARTCPAGSTTRCNRRSGEELGWACGTGPLRANSRETLNKFSHTAHVAMMLGLQTLCSACATQTCVTAVWGGWQRPRGVVPPPKRPLPTVSGSRGAACAPSTDLGASGRPEAAADRLNRPWGRMTRTAPRRGPSARSRPCSRYPHLRLASCSPFGGPQGSSGLPARG